MIGSPEKEQAAESPEGAAVENGPEDGVEGEQPEDTGAGEEQAAAGEEGGAAAAEGTSADDPQQSGASGRGSKPPSRKTSPTSSKSSSPDTSPEKTSPPKSTSPPKTMMTKAIESAANAPSLMGAPEGGACAKPGTGTEESSPLLQQQQDPHQDDQDGDQDPEDVETEEPRSVFSGAFAFMVTLVLFLVLPVVFIVMGSVYYKKCPVEPFLAQYLIIEGCVGIAMFFLKLVKGILARKPNTYRTFQKVLNHLNALITLAFIGIFIAGCVMVYLLYINVQSADPLQDSYCHYVLYSFVFWIQSFLLLLVLVSVVSCFGAMCCGCIDGSQAVRDVYGGTW